MNHLVLVEQVTVALGGRRVLDRVDATVGPGEQVAVTGRSGSGKTTLLLVLAGLVRPSSGHVDIAVPREQVHYVPQAPSLLPELTALENAALGLRLRGVDPCEATTRAADELVAFGLPNAHDALPDQLSGGMQQRVCLARGSVVAPRLLLVDEPTASLDRATGDQVLGVLLDVALRRGTALVVATHDAALAGRLSRRIALSSAVSA